LPSSVSPATGPGESSAIGPTKPVIAGTAASRARRTFMRRPVGGRRLFGRRPFCGAFFGALGEFFVVFGNSEHHAFRFGIIHLLGDGASLLRTPKPVGGIMDERRIFHEFKP